MSDKEARDSRMRRSTLAVELQDKGKRLSEVRRGSAFDLVAKGGDEITREQFEKLHDVIAAEMEAEMEAAATLAKKSAAIKRKLKLFICALASLMFVLMLSLLGNFFIIFFVVDGQVKTTTTSNGLLQAKNSDLIVKTVTATEDLPLIVAPVLDLDTLATAKTLKVTYNDGLNMVEAELGLAGVRKHNSTFVEFETTVPGDTVEVLNGKAHLVRVYPAGTHHSATEAKYAICSANATCSAFTASGVDANMALDRAAHELEKHGFVSGGSGECVDSPDLLVAVHSKYAFSSCAEAGRHGLCDNPAVKAGCCLTCTGSQLHNGRSMSSKGWCPPPVPSWKAFTYTGGGAYQFADAHVRLYSGHSTTRNVVYGLHGYGANGEIIRDYYGTTFDEPQYEGLMYVYPTSGELAWGDRSWKSNSGWWPTNNAADYVNIAFPQLSSFRSYLIANSNSWPSGTPSRVKSWSKFLSLGWSDGGRASITANLHNSATSIHSACGIAGHPMGQYSSIVNTMDSSNVRIHAYWHDGDFFYEPNAMPAYAAELSLGAPAPSSFTRDGYAFVRDTWTGSNKRVVNDVTGDSFGAMGTQNNPISHINFLMQVGLNDQIVNECMAQFIADITPSYALDLWLVKLLANAEGESTDARPSSSGDGEDKSVRGMSKLVARYSWNQLASRNEMKRGME